MDENLIVKREREGKLPATEESIRRDSLDGGKRCTIAYAKGATRLPHKRTKIEMSDANIYHTNPLARVYLIYIDLAKTRIFEIN